MNKNNEQQNPKSISKTVWGVLAALIVGGLVLGIYFMNTAKDNATLRNFEEVQNLVGLDKTAFDATLATWTKTEYQGYLMELKGDSVYVLLDSDFTGNDFEELFVSVQGKDLNKVYHNLVTDIDTTTVDIEKRPLDVSLLFD